MEARAEVTPNRRGLKSRELVLDAAERVMAADGFEAATVARVVGEAGIRRAPSTTTSARRTASSSRSWSAAPSASSPTYPPSSGASGAPSSIWPRSWPRPFRRSSATPTSCACWSVSRRSRSAAGNGEVRGGSRGRAAGARVAAGADRARLRRRSRQPDHRPARPFRTRPPSTAHSSPARATAAGRTFERLLVPLAPSPGRSATRRSSRPRPSRAEVITRNA